MLEIEAICFYKRDHFKKDFFNTYLDICFWSSNRKEKGEKEIGKLCRQVLSATDFKDSDSLLDPNVLVEPSKGQENPYFYKSVTSEAFRTIAFSFF